MASAPHRSAIVYKIFRADEWAAASRDGFFKGSPDDLRDGFVHLSAPHQVAGTAARHFRGQPGLVLASIDVAMLGAGLRWEASRGGEPFPHLYDVLDLKSVRNATPLELGADGVPMVPRDLPEC